MQVALQGFDFEAVARVLDPALQGHAGAVENVETFLEEDIHQLRVLAAVEGLGIGGCIGQRLGDLHFQQLVQGHFGRLGNDGLGHFVLACRCVIGGGQGGV
ncbi:hypothetical protein D9M71_297660 [compost metagenome]